MFCMLQTVRRSLRASSPAVDEVLFRVESQCSGEQLVEKSTGWTCPIPSCSMSPAAGGLPASLWSPPTITEYGILHASNVSRRKCMLSYAANVKTEFGFTLEQRDDGFV